MIDLNELFSKEPSKTFVVAEIGINHSGNFDKLIEMISEAKKCGADAVKFQIYSKDGFYIDPRFLPKDHTYKLPLDVFDKCFITYDKYKEAFKYSENIGILPFATPLDIESFEFLESIGNKMYKVASSDISYIPLLLKIKSTRKPVIVSTGFSKEKEIKKVLNLFYNYPIVIMHCVSNYPAKPEELSIKFFEKLKKIHKYLGFSDHSKTISMPIAFATLGARIIEKHFAIDDESPDIAVSLKSEEFKIMVQMIREVDEAKKHKTKYIPTFQELSRRSIVARREISKSKIITIDDIEAKRPAIYKEINLKNINRLLGRKAKKYYTKGEPLI